MLQKPKTSLVVRIATDQMSGDRIKFHFFQINGKTWDHSFDPKHTVEQVKRYIQKYWFDSKPPPVINLILEHTCLENGWQLQEADIITGNRIQVVVEKPQPICEQCGSWYDVDADGVVNASAYPGHRCKRCRTRLC